MSKQEPFGVYPGYFHFQLYELLDVAREFKEGKITQADFVYTVEEIAGKLLQALEGI